jgi:hypothetical protein
MRIQHVNARPRGGGESFVDTATGNLDHIRALVAAENAQPARVGLVQIQLGAGEKLGLWIRHGRF